TAERMRHGCFIPTAGRGVGIPGSMASRDRFIAKMGSQMVNHHAPCRQSGPGGIESAGGQFFALEFHFLFDDFRQRRKLLPP
ncbi:MAG TPA: hypothetical protein VGI63_03685, partial [Verrucomicrobiae bacterium]